jgi:hypothetical protein
MDIKLVTIIGESTDMFPHMVRLLFAKMLLGFRIKNLRVVVIPRISAICARCSRSFGSVWARSFVCSVPGVVYCWRTSLCDTTRSLQASASKTRARRL